MPTVPYAQRVARGIKDRVLVARITRERIAELLGVNVSAVSRRLSGRQEWTLTELELIAPLLGCRPEDLAAPTE